MAAENSSLTRRAFFRKAGAAGAGAIAASLSAMAGAAEKKPPPAVPTRPFGKTGIDVPILALGGVLGESETLVYRRAFQLRARYWDTADSYRWGGSEKAIGKYLKRFADDRKKIFLVTKSGRTDPEGLDKDLAQSLRRMGTSYVDMYFIHGVGDAERELTPAVKGWAEKAKREGKIRLFGFSAHKNMERSMHTAARLGWIDGLMVSYNYRLMTKDSMKRAVDACAAAGIGLTAMKTQAAFSANFYASIGSETDEGLKMTEGFMEKGFTAEQAKLKAVWENPMIASICSAMPNMTILQANAAAADLERLSSGDRRRLALYAAITAPGYCAGCAELCESAVDRKVPICDIMRYAMYANGYADRRRAVRLLRRLPADMKNRIATTDFSGAESACPQGVRITAILEEACRLLDES